MLTRHFTLVPLITVIYGFIGCSDGKTNSSLSQQTPALLKEAAALYPSDFVEFEFTAFTSRGQQTYFNAEGAARLAKALNAYHDNFMADDLPTFRKTRTKLVLTVSNHWAFDSHVPHYDDLPFPSQLRFKINGFVSENNYDLDKDWARIFRRQIKFAKILATHAGRSVDEFVSVKTSGFGDIFVSMRVAKFWNMIEDMPQALAGARNLGLQLDPLNEDFPKRVRLQLVDAREKPDKLRILLGADRFIGSGGANWYIFQLNVNTPKPDTGEKDNIPGLAALAEANLEYFQREIRE